MQPDFRVEKGNQVVAQEVNAGLPWGVRHFWASHIFRLIKYKFAQERTGPEEVLDLLVREVDQELLKVIHFKGFESEHIKELDGREIEGRVEVQRFISPPNQISEGGVVQQLTESVPSQQGSSGVQICRGH